MSTLPLPAVPRRRRPATTPRRPLSSPPISPRRPSRADPAGSPAPHRASSFLRSAVIAAVLVLALVFLLRDRLAFAGAIRSLAGSDGEWLLVAGVGTALLWVSGTLAQLGALSWSPPVGRLLAVQVAASFANQILPAGAGGLAVNVRFLRRQGMTRESALASQALNQGAGALTHMVLLALAVASSPAALRDFASGAAALASRGQSGVSVVASPFRSPLPGGQSGIVVLAVLAAGVAAAALAVTLSRRRAAAVAAGRVPASLRQSTSRGLGRAARAARSELAALAAILRHPGRGLGLWLGSFSAPMLHALILVAVLRAIGSPVPVGTTILVYLVASAGSALIPSPGGFGALDVTLSTALVAVGVPTTFALAAVMGYRLITVWAPLVPGACVFAMLLRCRVV